MSSGVTFPVPRITESFVTKVINDIGGKCLAEVFEIKEGESNADYIFSDAIIELKIIEEEGLEKESRQQKIAALFQLHQIDQEIISLDPEDTPEAVVNELLSILLEPLKTPVKKASKQLKSTASIAGNENLLKILLIVNNEYFSLGHEVFEKLVKRVCQKDSTTIEIVICASVEYHQGDFDAYIFCVINEYEIRGSREWGLLDQFRHEFQEKFSDAMGKMMVDQMNPNFWKSNLPPVREILFEKDEVKYIREAPEAPDSRF